MSEFQVRSRRVALPSRGGESALLDIGPPERPVDLVFSHANGFNARTYLSILGPLAATRRILMVDQRGHGQSGLAADLSPDRASWQDLADDLIALLEAEDLRNVVLSGHSMGAAISLVAAPDVSERVSGLVLFDPVIMGPDFKPVTSPEAGETNPMVQAALRRRSTFPSRADVIQAYTGRGAFRSWTPTMLADYVTDGVRETATGEVELTCLPAWEASNFNTANLGPWSAFAGISAPIRLFKADVGSTCRTDGHEDKLLARGNVTIETVPGSSHFLPMERPDLVRAALG